VKHTSAQIEKYLQEMVSGKTTLNANMASQEESVEMRNILNGILTLFDNWQSSINKSVSDVDRELEKALVEAEEQKSKTKQSNKALLNLMEDLQEEKEKLAESHKMQIELQAIASQSAKLASVGVLAAGVGHEINNPLAIATGYMARVKKDLVENNRGSKKILDYIEKVEIANERVRKIVDGLRTFSRSDTDHLEAISLQEAVDQTVNLISEIYEKDGISIIREDSGLDLLTKGNLGKLQQIILNLIDNAKDATEGRESRKIYLSLKKNSKDTLIFSVRDNGEGISDEIRDKILDPFFTTKGVGNGTGMGLGIVVKLLHELKGELVIDSEVEVGSTFSVILPLLGGEVGGQEQGQEQ
jgi:C4-dicarboxylate-specific signal transduction histidine kinase